MALPDKVIEVIEKGTGGYKRKIHYQDENGDEAVYDSEASFNKLRVTFKEHDITATEYDSGKDFEKEHLKVKITKGIPLPLLDYDGQGIKLGHRYIMMKRAQEGERCPRNGLMWEASWVPEMNKAVGAIGTIQEITRGDGVRFEEESTFEDFVYPWFVLHYVGPRKEAKDGEESTEKG